MKKTNKIKGISGYIGWDREEEWLTPKEVAELLDLHIQHVYKLIRTESIPFYDLRTKGAERACYRVNRKELYQWLQTRHK